MTKRGHDDVVMTGKTYQRRNKRVVPQESGNNRG
jgi:hypothetical protein